MRGSRAGIALLTNHWSLADSGVAGLRRWSLMAWKEPPAYLPAAHFWDMSIEDFRALKWFWNHRLAWEMSSNVLGDTPRRSRCSRCSRSETSSNGPRPLFRL